MQQPIDIHTALEDILAHETRYDREAYLFVMAALNHAVAELSTPRHVSGHELLMAFQSYTKAQFGPMAKDVLHAWGIKTTEDVGHIVFHLIEANILGKTESDSLQDFQDVYHFDDVFTADFDLPSASA